MFVYFFIFIFFLVFIDCVPCGVFLYIILFLQGVRFNEIITEPKHLQTNVLFWYASTLCYERWRIFVYQCLGFCTLPCIATSMGKLMGCLLFTAIWIFSPASRVWQKIINMAESIIISLVHGKLGFIKKCWKVLKEKRNKEGKKSEKAENENKMNLSGLETV